MTQLTVARLLLSCSPYPETPSDLQPARDGWFKLNIEELLVVISTSISGREVTGVVIDRTAENLSVEIISPFHYVMMTAYLPKIILSYANFDDRYGDEWAEILLAHIYEMCAYSWLNIDRLGHEFSKLKEDLAALDELGLGAEEVRYQTYSMKMQFFRINYPNMNVRESSWNSLLEFIKNLRDTPHRFHKTQ